MTSRPSIKNTSHIPLHRTTTFQDIRFYIDDLILNQRQYDVWSYLHAKFDEMKTTIANFPTFQTTGSNHKKNTPASIGFIGLTHK